MFYLSNHIHFCYSIVFMHNSLFFLQKKLETQWHIDLGITEGEEGVWILQPCSRIPILPRFNISRKMWFWFLNDESKLCVPAEEFSIAFHSVCQNLGHLRRCHFHVSCRKSIALYHHVSNCTFMIGNLIKTAQLSEAQRNNELCPITTFLLFFALFLQMSTQCCQTQNSGHRIRLSS